MLLGSRCRQAADADRTACRRKDGPSLPSRAAPGPPGQGALGKGVQSPSPAPELSPEGGEELGALRAAGRCSCLLRTRAPGDSGPRPPRSLRAARPPARTCSPVHGPCPACEEPAHVACPHGQPLLHSAFAVAATRPSHPETLWGGSQALVHCVCQTRTPRPVSW